MELVHLHMKITVKLDLIQKVNRKMMIHEFYSLMYRAVNSNLEAVLKFRYKGVVVYAERLFFSTKKGVIYSRDYFSTTTNNLIYIRIISSRKIMSPLLCMVVQKS